LSGIIHPARAAAKVGVLIVVGGPQYRVGSHRQFVLMARRFANAGIPVLRFDYRGMGDSAGAVRSFEEVDDDIHAAIGRFHVAQPALKKVVLLGLCDAASANLMYAAKDERVHGLVMMNPWVRTEQGEAKAYLKHYYLQRLLQKSFWRKLFTGKFEVMQSGRQFVKSLRDSRASKEGAGAEPSEESRFFIDRMLSGFVAFQHPVLILISGRDLTAQEFVSLCKQNKAWKTCVAQAAVETHQLPDADHTMSSRPQLDEASTYVLGWISDRFLS
jgi:exosortase A-associated hydrolase 1